MPHFVSALLPFPRTSFHTLWPLIWTARRPYPGSLQYDYITIRFVTHHFHAWDT